MFEWKVFLGGMFLAAAAIGTLVSVAAPTIALPALALGRAGSVVELGGSLIGGILAVLFSKRRHP